MKNIKVVFLISISITLSFISCSDSKVDVAKKKLEDISCKAEFAQFLLENGTQTMTLGKRIGLSKELEQFQKLQADSTVACDSIKKAWYNFSDLVTAKSESK